MTETHEATHAAPATSNPRKERTALAGFGLLAVATADLLVWAYGRTSARRRRPTPPPPSRWLPARR
ncbi:hypothetical protein AB0D11_44085 [Streptomyces monashensis]|uniref:hypothetical protein n=1 Tax=Streptomyces monashensis TaxID=1678012 RepID=UPI0033CF0048